VIKVYQRGIRLARGGATGPHDRDTTQGCSDRG
jgi:hypothetical protein